MVRWHYGGRICTSCRNAKVRNDKIKGTTIAIVILSVVVIDRLVMIDVTKKMVLSHRNEVENEPAIFRSFCKEVDLGHLIFNQHFRDSR